MSNRDFERRWERMQQLLGAEARGDEPRPFASTRTLFGIRSTVEQQLDALVAEEEERKRRERVARARAAAGGDAPGAPGGAGVPCAPGGADATGAPGAAGGAGGEEAE